jgi:hypothetical protein
VFAGITQQQGLHIACQLHQQHWKESFKAAHQQYLLMSCNSTALTMKCDPTLRLLQVLLVLAAAHAAQARMLTLHHAALHDAVLQDSTTVWRRSLAWTPS